MMKTKYSTNRRLNYLFLAIVATSLMSCVREELVLPEAPFPNTAEIFTDTFIGMGTNFYFPFVGDGAKPDVFSVDENVGYESNASIRFDVPDADDPGGGFAGATFEVDGGARNLTEYNALTFWGKASQSATIGTMGFGFEYQATLNDLNFTTQWKKYVIPIPDPSKLTEVKTVFVFSAGGIGPEGMEVGYTFWVDELKFENLASVAQPQAQIMNGRDETITSFNGVTLPVTGISVLYNVDGVDVPVNTASSYLNFTSSDPSVASVAPNGQVTVLQAGTTTITATLGSGSGELEAIGSLTITSTGDFISAPTPPARDAADVVSIFSDAYENVQVDNYNGFFEFATTQGGAINIGGDNIISYSELNFVSINMFNSPNVDASEMTHIHVDVNVREAVNPGDFLRFQIINNNGPSETSGFVNLGDYSPLLEEEWVSYDIPVSDFAGLGGTEDVDLIFFVSDGTISNVYIDNVYFYK
jgi:hypothetical protein